MYWINIHLWSFVDWIDVINDDVDYLKDIMYIVNKYYGDNNW